MKILQINKYHYIRGGSDSVYFNTSKLLKEKGHEVINFAMDFNENEKCDQEEYFAENKDFVTLPFIQKIKNVPSFFYNREAENKLRALIQKNKPDIAHLHIFYGSLTSSILKVFQDEGIPAVVSVHDYKFVCPSYLFLDGENNICEACEGKHFKHAILKKCVKGSRLFSATFALEAYYRDRFYPLHRMFQKLIFVSKFSETIHNKYKPELTEISTHLYNFDPSLNEGEVKPVKGRYFLFAGRLSKEKGLHTLLKAFKELPEVELKIAGGGDQLEPLKEQAPNNIIFMGFQSSKKLKEIIAGASFVIIPSEWYENNPMAIIEAYSLGKPVIAANIGGIPEIVIDNTTGYLFDSGNIDDLKKKIIQADQVTDDKYEFMSQKILAFAKANFHPEVHYYKLMSIYNSVLTNLAS